MCEIICEHVYWILTVVAHWKQLTKSLWIQDRLNKFLHQKNSILCLYKRAFCLFISMIRTWMYPENFKINALNYVN